MIMGECWLEDMVEDLFYGVFIYNGLFDYKEFMCMLKYGLCDKEDDQVFFILLEELVFKFNILI